MSIVPVRHRHLHVAVLDAPHPHGSPECTVFFVHGAMGSLEQWRFQAAAANTRYRVVSYDYFGCGKSPREDSWEAYSTEEHLKDLLALFDQTKTKRNVLVGHSFGCSQVLRLAKERPQDVSGVVLVAPAHFPDGGHPIFRLPEFMLRWIQPALSKNFMTMALHPETREGKTEQHKELLRVAEARSSTNSMHVAKSFYRQIKFAKEHEVAAINGQIPVSIICGSDDKLTPVSMAEKFIAWLQERDPTNGKDSVNLHIVGPASHQVMEEQPETVNEILLKFLEHSFADQWIVSN